MKSMRRIGTALVAVSVIGAPALAGDSIVVGDRMIELNTVVEASVSEVWTAWTNGDELREWFGSENSVEIRPGGPYEIYFLMDSPEGSRGSEGCKVLSYLPERMLSFSWNAPPIYPEVRDGGMNTIVVVNFEPLGKDRSRVVIRHHGWPSKSTTTEQWDGTFEYFEKAWPQVLGALTEHFDDARAKASDPANAWVYLFVSFSRPDLLDTLTEDETKILQNHFQHLKQLTEEGKVVLAGPCTDFKGPGIVIFHADNEEEARRIMESDPAVKGGVFNAELHPMRLSLLRERDS